MTLLKTTFAFALGFLITSTVGPALFHAGAASSDSSDLHVCVDSSGELKMTDLTATCPKGQQSLLLKQAEDPDPEPGAKQPENRDSSQIDATILANLNRRLKQLENLNCTAPGRSRVVAPFELKDRNGARIFYVDRNAVGLFNSSGQAVARIVVFPQGGLFVAQQGNNTASFGISDTVAGLSLRENNQLRIELGTNPQIGSYRLNVRSASGETVAAIGQAGSRDGLAIIRDGSGKTKATMGVSEKGAGLIEVLAGKSVAQLTEGDQNHGGKLWIGNAAGLGMVEAGDGGGFGIVRVGPSGFKFIPTPGLALPGSVIIGK